MKYFYFKIIFLGILFSTNLLYIEKAFCATLVPDIKNYYYIDNKEIENDKNIIKESVIDNKKEEGQININLSYFPNEPVNNQNLAVDDFYNENVVTVYSKSDIDENKSEYFYDWFVEAEIKNKERDGEEILFDITDYLDKKTQSSGYGLSEFSFKLNFSTDDLKNIFKNEDKKDYNLKVKVVISKKIDEYNDSEKGKSFINISFLNNIDILQYSLAKVENDNKLGFDENNQTCLEKNDFEVCRVIKNEIIGVRILNDKNKYSNFRWALNGNEIKCNPSIYYGCGDETSLDMVFFPIIGSDGEFINLSLNMEDLITGETKTIEKRFIIINPIVKIEKLGGIYDENIIQTSLSDFYVIPKGEVVDFKIQTEPRWIQNNIKTKWVISGEKEVFYDDLKQISLPVKSDAGTAYNIKIEYRHVFSGDKNNLLQSVWGVSNVNLFGNKEESNVRIKVIENKKISKNPFETSSTFLDNVWQDFRNGKIFYFKLFIITILLSTVPIILSYFTNNGKNSV